MTEQPKAWIDENGTLRAPDGYRFEIVDLPGFDASGYQRKGVRIVRSNTVFTTSPGAAPEAVALTPEMIAGGAHILRMATPAILKHASGQLAQQVYMAMTAQRNQAGESDQ